MKHGKFDIAFFLIILPSMPVRVPTKTAASTIVSQDEGHLAPFFYEKNSDDPRIIRFEPYSAEGIGFFRGRTAERLQELLDSRVRNNNTGLDLSWINTHDRAHMARVASATHQIGTRLPGYDPIEVSAAAFGTDFHDIGYTFPDDLDVQLKKKNVSFHDYGKKAQGAHPEKGASLFVDTVRNLRRRDDSVAEELGDWDAVEPFAHDAILYHSNGSAYKSDEVGDLVKIPRMVDKLDNTRRRVFPRHMNAIRAVALGASVEEVQDSAHRGIEVLTHSPVVSGKTFQEMEGAIHEVDSNFPHRVVPFAIVDQYLSFDAQSGDFVMHYAVHAEGVANHLGVEYSSDDFLRHFDRAYSSDSMPRAAEVAYSLKKNQTPAKDVDPKKSSLRILFHFTDGKVAQRDYAPKFD